MKQRLHLFMASLLIVMLVMGAGQFGSWLARIVYPNSAEAQTPPTIITSGDIKRGLLEYTWTEGADPASELRLKCRPDGTAVGQYTFNRVLPVSAKGNVALIDLLPKSGKYYCVVVGAAVIPGVTPTAYVEGVASPEYPFVVGVGPSGQGSISISFK
jgi:hypothetical protein